MFKKSFLNKLSHEIVITFLKKKYKRSFSRRNSAECCNTSKLQHNGFCAKEFPRYIIWMRVCYKYKRIKLEKNEHSIHYRDTVCFLCTCVPAAACVLDIRCAGQESAASAHGEQVLRRASQRNTTDTHTHTQIKRTHVCVSERSAELKSPI